MAQSHSLAGTLPIYVLNGPNLNLIGSREPHLYGTATLGDIERTVAARARGLGLSVVFRQTNQEGQLIDWIHEARERAGGVILNAGGYSHTSVALLDACRALDKPLIEVHLSNPYRRESYRHHSYVSEAASGLVCGFGADGYLLAVEAMAKLIENQPVRT